MCVQEKVALPFWRWMLVVDGLEWPPFGSIWLHLAQLAGCQTGEKREQTRERENRGWPDWDGI